MAAWLPCEWECHPLLEGLGAKACFAHAAAVLHGASHTMYIVGREARVWLFGGVCCWADQHFSVCARGPKLRSSVHLLQAAAVLRIHHTCEGYYVCCLLRQGTPLVAACWYLLVLLHLLRPNTLSLSLCVQLAGAQYRRAAHQVRLTPPRTPSFERACLLVCHQ